MDIGLIFPNHLRGAMGGRGRVSQPADGCAGARPCRAMMSVGKSALGARGAERRLKSRKWPNPFAKKSL
jgi:hypothetical protein